MKKKNKAEAPGGVMHYKVCILLYCEADGFMF